MNNLNIPKLKNAILFLTGLILFIPLIPPAINGFFYFPYIFPKALAFKVIAEIMLLLYLYLAFVARTYRPKFNWLFAVFSLFVLSALISSIFGLDLYKSFWGTVERSEGIIFWLHLWAFFFVLINVFKEKADWVFIFDLSLISGLLTSLIALSQILNLGLVASPGGERVTAIFGNASFLAAYMIFQVALAAYLLILKENIYSKIYYGFLLAFFIYIIFFTLTRGAILGLIGGFAVCGLLSIFNKRTPVKIKMAFGSLIGLMILATVFLYASRDSGWVQNNAVLRRLTSISIQDVTTRNRLASWNSSYLAWQQQPLFGYGLENFNIVFNQNFAPIIYNDEGSQIWFDRAHNLIFDRAVTTGLVGLGLYLVFIFLPLYFIFKSEEPLAEKLPFVGLILAFFIQDLFVFESTTTYLILITVWAYLSLNGPQFGLNLLKSEGKFALPYKTWAILILPVLFFVNLKPAQANLDFLRGLQMTPDKYTLEQTVGQFKKALEVQTPGLAEYRFRFIEFFDQIAAAYKDDPAAIKPFIDYADQVAEKMIAAQPKNAAVYLLAMRYNNITHVLVKGQEAGRLNLALAYLPKLIELAPTRSQIYREAAYSNLYLSQFYKNSDDPVSAQKAISESLKLIDQAIKINPAVVELRIDHIMILLNQGDAAEIRRQVALFDEQNIAYRDEAYLQKLVNLSITNKNFDSVALFAEELVLIEPGNIDLKINLALAYAYLGKNEEAIRVANEVRVLGQGSRDKQVADFIDSVKAGKFKIQ